MSEGNREKSDLAEMNVGAVRHGWERPAETRRRQQSESELPRWDQRAPSVERQWFIAISSAVQRAVPDFQGAI